MIALIDSILIPILILLLIAIPILILILIFRRRPGNFPAQEEPYQHAAPPESRMPTLNTRNSLPYIFVFFVEIAHVYRPILIKTLRLCLTLGTDRSVWMLVDTLPSRNHWLQLACLRERINQMSHLSSDSIASSSSQCYSWINCIEAKLALFYLWKSQPLTTSRSSYQKNTTCLYH